ncbi:Lrp/AsnC family transcriptional regulator [Methylobacterium dankookense]|uniref:Transcription regulator AsnC/Lrp ligand binding domain-containing protein n=1 Tax=Methylobacterium dankookense TaxID=560405 RepID=A0A564G978_9HYPH|nr:Lrp/AsnC family transcriptional regulator [Methylobacterium dankookense]GJD59864.1 hypothetical protein IFDJLNFL_5795 [Methylobacterium dankookense]VUF16101.1 hypothetical protein MTDSW087_05852 [Methylobacterium dankookense]
MKTFFVQIKCELGKTYDVADQLVHRSIASEIYSTAGHFDLIAKFHVNDSVEIGQFIAENVQSLNNIRDTETIVAYRAFS